MQIPVTARNASALAEEGSTASKPALAIAPTAAAMLNSRRGSTRSASPSNALATHPTTKPSCTALVSAACTNGVSRNCAVSAGRTADAENQSDIAATWHKAMIAIETAFDRLPGTITPPPIIEADVSIRDRPRRANGRSFRCLSQSEPHGLQSLQPADASRDQLHEPVL